METDKQEPIAIIGLGCRFPGEAGNPNGFWELLSKGESAWSKVPRNRFDIDGYHHPSSDRGGAIITNSGFFLKQDPAKWDAAFFSMTPAEAAGTDPQQRILLEVAYEAFESAGMSVKDVAGSLTSCYMGAFNADYGVTSMSYIWDSSQYSATGLGMSMISNRLSWFYDLRGGSVTIDTACSSSLIAMHLGIQSLRTGEAKMSIVGGANLILQPESMRGLSALRFLSPDGVCHSFDESANGYARGEGFGVLVLKPLKDALRDNDTIRAVIRGSYVNQDGKTPAITVPSSEAQADLINTAYKNAGLDLDGTQYFEAHGTGTAVGDPIELSGIGCSVGAGRTEANALYVGSVKTNLGHLESTAGMGGVIKTVLAMEHGMIPSVVGLENVNPRIQLEEWGIKLNTDLVPWPQCDVRRASVNSFGYGGANAHVILDDAKHYMEQRGLVGNHVTVGHHESISSVSSDSGVSIGTPTSETGGFSTMQKAPFRSPKLLVLSSPEQGGTARLAETYATYLDLRQQQLQAQMEESDDFMSIDSDYLENLAYTLGERRSAFDWRTFAVAGSVEEFQATAQRGLPNLRRTARNPAYACVFTGQGSQYFNMGRELQSNAVFLKSVMLADKYLASLGCPWSVMEEMNKSEESSKINQPELSQPICTILQVAIVDLLKHWGTSPSAVVGHSSGEIGAAYAAGFLSQEDAWKIAYFRGLLSGNLAKAHPELDGIMMAVALSEDAVLGYTERTASGKVVAACINSPSSVTLSGDKTAIEEVQKLLETDNVWCRKLKVTTAYHSHHMNFIAGDYLKSIEDIKPLDTDGSIRMFSSVTGKRILPADLGASYWVQNMLSPVRFSTAVSALLAPSDARSRRQKLPSVQVLLELGPHSVLKGPLNQILGASASGYENAVTYVSVLQRGTDAYKSAIISAGKLWGAGQELNLGNVNSADEVPTRRKVLTDLPPYPWNHERSHWHESRQNAFKRLHARARTDLLGYPSDNFDPLASSHRWVNLLKPFEIPWVQDHVIQGNVIFPASGMIAMALEACQQLVDPAKTLEGFEFRDINFTRALLFATADSSHEVSMQFRPHVLGTRASTYVWHKFNMNSISAEGVTAEHCNGLVRVKYATKASEVENGLEAALESKAFKDTYEQISFKCHKEINVPQLYSDIAEEGMQFGPLFRLLSDMRGGEDVGVSSITIPDTAAIMPSNREFPLLLHPCVLDAIFQLMWSRAAYGDNSTGTMSVVAYVGNLFISADLPNSPGTVLRAYQSSKVMGHRDIFADIVVSDGDFAKPFVVCKQLVTTGLAIDGGSKVDATTTLLATRLVWKEDVASLSQESASLLGTPDSGVEIDMLSKATLLEQSAVIYIQRALSLLGLDRDKAVVQHPAIDWIRQYNTASFREDETTILTAAAESSSLGKAIEVIGTNLARVLDGSMDAHKLFLDEGLGSSRDFADELLCKELINSRIAAWFDLAGDKNPELQVLEIGNGSVSTAVSILGTLASQGAAGPRYDLYTFVETDSSRVADVKTLLKEYPNVNVQSFDIERDLAMQHITKKYDVVIINNMGLANADVDFAIKNAKVLLKPGGTLIVAATATLSSRAVLVLGSTEKWWIARGANALPQTRCIPLDAWSKLLVENGMTSPEILIPDSLDSRLHQMSIILSTSQKEEVQKLQPVVILESAQMAPSTSALSSNLLKLLIGQGFSVVKSTLATMPEPADTFFISLIDIDAPLLDHLCEEEFSSLRTLTTKSAGVLWMTHGGLKSGDSLPSHASLVGLFRTIRAEAPHLRLFTLDLSSTIDLCSKGPSDLILRLFNTSFSAQDDPVVDYEYAESDGKLFIPRLVQDETMNTSLVNRTELPTPEMAPLFQPGRPLKMVVGELGLLDTMRFVDRPEMQGPLPADCIDVQILATGLNFVDIMAALGYIPSPSLGAEYSGVVTAVGSAVPEEECHVGQIVVGSAECCIASNVRVHWKMVNEVPKGIAPEAAATCLIAYSTAYFALYDNGRLKPTDTILIHYAAGGLGQAAIQLAQHIGATIYCTVGSLEKKNLIMQQYGIPENQIFNSRDMTFKQGIMRETKGRGVDVILNSTFGEMLRETWNCLADHGIMVEVGKRDILSNNSLEMAPFIRGCTFSALNLAQYTEDSEPHRLRNYQAVVKKVFKLLGDGVITTPYPLQVMDVTEAEEAFRALQSGRFSGKTVLMMNQSAIVPVLPKKKEPLELDPDATYLLAGGLGGIGRSLSNLLENHGAKHIAFVSRSGDANGEASITLEKLREKGVNAVAYKCDITDREALEAVLQKCTAEMPPFKGFVNCAMLLKDTIFENMTHSDWVAATGPKIQGSWNMHEILPANLDFFIMLSSTSGIIGNPGQANYAAGNTFQNGLAHHRRRKGLKATSIDLSAVAGIGYLAENSAAYEQRKTLLKMTIKEDEIHHIFLAAIEGVIKGDQEMPPQMTTGIIGGEVLRSLMPVAPWANDSKFILLRKADGLSGSSAGGDTALKDAFLVSESIAEAAVIVEMALTARLAKALFINSEDIDIAKPLHSYGVDSLIAVEVRNWVMKEIKSDISILDILSPMPISQLAHKIADGSKLLPASFKVEGASANEVEKAAGAAEIEEVKIVNASEADVEMKGSRMNLMTQLGRLDVEGRKEDKKPILEIIAPKVDLEEVIVQVQELAL